MPQDYTLRRRQISLSCTHCGKLITLTPSRVAKGEGKYCSRKCQYTHGETRTRHSEVSGTLQPSYEYVAWTSIKRRCLNPHTPKYPIYGGRGIMICDRWINSFEAFLEDMGRRPGQGYSIDRIDNNGDYVPGNVRWATRLEQAHNKRNNVLLTLDGVTRCLSEWAGILGIHPKTLKARLQRGWSLNRALTAPPRIRPSKGDTM